MPNFDQPKPLSNETPEDTATRLAGDLELAPLEEESPAEQKAEMVLEPLPDPAIETARAEQVRQDEVARNAELARADALAAQIKSKNVEKTGKMDELLIELSEQVEQGKSDLQRRINGEISGVELDQLDSERDRKIDALRSEMKRGIEEVPSKQTANTEHNSIRNSEGSLTPEEFLSVSIDSVTNRRSLMRVLSQLGEITAADGHVYEKGYFIPIIGSLKNADDPNLQMVTSTGGLRDRVRKILKIEEVEKGL
ncbi:MAG: hypothetical protein KBB77_02040 [Candidatus Moranbacteria bacterium]|nr:hypothetical protein [Candidatus Moranbacteria bacterium]